MRRRANAGVGLLVATLASAALPPSAWAADVPAPAVPRITVEPAGFAFGDVLPSRVVAKEFVIRNLGAAVLQIQSVTTSCDCTVADEYVKSIKPGGSTPLRVSVTLPGTPGRMVKSVLIKSNDPARPAVEVKIEARVVAPRVRQ